MGFLNLVREIFQIYDPTWGDIQNLLHVLLTGAEQASLFKSPRGSRQREKNNSSHAHIRWGNQAIPENEPNGDLKQ